MFNLLNKLFDKEIRRQAKKEKAMKLAKKRILSYVDNLKAHGYRELTKKEQFRIEHYINDWFEEEEIILIKDTDTCSYILVIKMWHPSVITYYISSGDMQNIMMSEEHVVPEKHLCVLLGWEVKWVSKILEEWYALGDTFFNFDDLSESCRSNLE